jgi:hypothetical protein
MEARDATDDEQQWDQNGKSLEEALLAGGSPHPRFFDLLSYLLRNERQRGGATLAHQLPRVVPRPARPAQAGVGRHG